MPLIGKGFTMLKDFQTAAKIPAIFNMPLNFCGLNPFPHRQHVVFHVRNSSFDLRK